MTKNDFSLLNRFVFRRGYLEPLILMVFVLVASILELFGVGVLYAFVKVITDQQILNKYLELIPFLDANYFSNVSNTIVIIGSLIVVTYVVKGIVGVGLVGLRVRFATRQAEYLSKEMMIHIAKMPYESHLKWHTADKVQKIFAETDLLGREVLLPYLTIVSEVLFSGVLLCFLLWYDSTLTFAVIFAFGSIYYVMYALLKPTLARSGQARQTLNRARLHSAMEFFNGIKDIKLSGNWSYFVNRFANANRLFVRRLIIIKTLPGIPSFVMQVLSMSGMVALLIYGVTARNMQASELFAWVAVFGVIGWRMMPSFSSLVRESLTIKGSFFLLEKYRQDLQREPDDYIKLHVVHEQMKVNSGMSIRQLDYKYPDEEKYVLKDITIDIPAGSSIGIVGPSGAGKSTLAEVIMGLLTPASGDFFVDNKKLLPDDMPKWRQSIGYVPQRIHISNNTIKNNIAFGIEPEKINDDNLLSVLEMSHFSEVVASLSDGVDSIVGENGVGLSGGQIQRLGIARSLYRKPKLLVMDEATSSLDNESERIVTSAIKTLCGKITTVIIAHRLSTIKHCDRIYLLDKGRISDYGTYQELLEKSVLFKKLAGYSTKEY